MENGIVVIPLEEYRSLVKAQASIEIIERILASEEDKYICKGEINNALPSRKVNE